MKIFLRFFLFAALAFCLSQFAWASQEEQPMRFQVVRSHSPKCGALCPAWIAAEGRIMRDTSAKFSRLLKDTKLRQLPLMLSSGGGEIDSAMAMGRLLKQYGMSVGIGGTIYDKCPGEAYSTKPCPEKKSPHFLTGYVQPFRSYCFSACPLVLLGGKTKIVEQLAQLGLHQPISKSQPYVDRYLETYRIIRGKKKIISRKFIKRTYLAVKTHVGLDKVLTKSLKNYISEMKASPEILAEMNKAKPKDINVIRPDVDLVRLGFESTPGLTLDSLIGPEICNAPTKPGNCLQAE